MLSQAMNLFRAIIKWTGITIGIAILSIIGFVFAAWLSPGDPARSYTIAAVTLAALALIFRILYPNQDQPGD